MKKRKAKTLLLLILIALTLAFIFANSMESIPQSSAKSQRLLKALAPALELFVGEGNATNNLIRKLAHFAEFFALGLELCALFALHKKAAVWPVFLGLCAALCDETIQIFYERGSQVQDVWLDFSAVVAAAVIVYIFGRALHRRKGRA